ncbi:MAG: DnaJ domain-containing protein, partial [Acidimicrobiia bacterium]|nr:DnaJ domain-containing protein [Acidimicrobiia bacterium]
MAPQREWFEKDYYKVLGVSESASQKDITKAYRQLARKNHPDANPGDDTAADRFKEISAAYDVVGDAAKRKEYDEVRRLGPMGGGGFGGGPFGAGGRNVRIEDLGDLGDLGDLLGGLFGGRGGGAGPRRRGRAPATPGDDLAADLHLSFEDSVNGLTTVVHLTSDAVCSTCKGSGAAPGTSVATCGNCGGAGTVADNQGPFSFSQPCPVCRGRGRMAETPCPTCRGTTIERRQREVKVRLPAGIEDGQVVRLAGKGAPSRFGGPPGDLLVTVHVATHRWFGRKGRHLTITVPISYPEAVLGAEISVPTLGGSAVKLKLPAGTRSGRTFRVGGRGVPGD